MSALESELKKQNDNLDDVKMRESKANSTLETLRSEMLEAEAARRERLHERARLDEDLAVARNELKEARLRREELRIQLDDETSRNSQQEQMIREQFEEHVSALKKTIAENESTIESTESELHEILALNQKKEKQLTEQFRKIEDLIELNTKQEMALLALQKHAEDIERNFKLISGEKNRTQSELDRANLESAKKSTEIALLTDEIEGLKEKKGDLETAVKDRARNSCFPSFELTNE